MKKLIMTVAAVCAAMLVRAAAYDWKASGTVFWGDDSATYEEFDGYTVYAFDANAFSKAAIVGLLGTGDLTALDKALGSGSVGGFEFGFAGSGLSSVERDGSDWADTYLVLLSDDNKYFATYDVAEVEITDAVKIGGAKLTTEDGWVLDNLPAAGVAGWAAVDAPEPTSGLLLMLGIAGLALRRKQK